DMESDSFTGGRDIALMARGGKTWAFIAAGTEGWHTADVTDPTRPVLLHTHRPSPQFSFRGVAIDADTNILAVTDSVSIYGGGQYGYVRFYDVSDPANPDYIGQEQLAEAWSGLPGRVAIYNGHAYVSTVMTGLHVVDITKARDYSKTTRGMAITSLFDTNGLGYGQPGDINVFSNKATLTTSKGYLVVLDLTVPSFPQELGHVEPSDTYDAFRAAAVDGYNYTDSSGLTQVMDLAVTASKTGGVHTVDLTNPYTPTVIGTVKNEDGTIFKAFASDIAISRNSGLAFITSGGAIYVIDIKDPFNPIMLNKIDAAPVGENGVIDELLGEVKALVEKDGWVYLASTDGGLRVLDLDPVYLELYCEDDILGNDPFCHDYYPALGAKTIIIRGYKEGYVAFDKNDEAKLKVNDNPREKSFRLTPLPGYACPEGSTEIAPCAVFKNISASGISIVMMKLETDQGYDKETVNLDLYIQNKDGEETLIKGGLSKDAREVLPINVRHNGNVTLGEVLGGTAVFVADKIESKSTGETPDKQGFDFVQEMLNQVVSRKRSVTNYRLVPEDGTFNDYDLIEAISVFKSEFNMGGIRQYGSNTDVRIGNTKVNIAYDENGKFKEYVSDSTDPSNSDDTTNIFRKMMKDYGKRDTASSYLWLNKIVDKGLLVGQTERSKRMLSIYPDNLINKGPGDVTGGEDTGLYELYSNVIAPFIDGMIARAKEFESATDFNNPTGSWQPRSNNAEQTTGVSYCFGCRDSVEEFKETVSSCKAPASPSIRDSYFERNFGATSLGRDQGSKWVAIGLPNGFAGYAGNSNDSAGANCELTGTKKLPGLYMGEWKARTSDNKVRYRVGENSKLIPLEKYNEFEPKNWSGIDCSGLVTHSILGGWNVFDDNSDVKKSMQLGVTEGITFDMKYNNGKPKVTNYWAVSTYWNPVGTSKKMVYEIKNKRNKTEKIEKMKRGDLVRYKRDPHITMVYEDPVCIGKQCRYKIIHAYGWRYYYPLNEKGKASNRGVFSRKVVITEQNISSKPVGFGRVMLWD
ncbi:MAG: hypothetical protein OEV42_21215, partial [Deltaproteobacteria bacterium]|nr:hypothetical protein [Deltaproteobacteria bacterium]